MVVELVLETRINKDGKTYQAVYAKLPDGKSVLLTFDRKPYFVIRKILKGGK